MYIATVRIPTLKALAEFPEHFDLLEVKPEGAASASAGDRWAAGTEVRLVAPDMPYTGMYQEQVEGFLETQQGFEGDYAAVKEQLVAMGYDGSTATNIRTAMKNSGLLQRA